MTDFTIKEPAIKVPSEIEKLSLETIMAEAKGIEKFNSFNTDEQKIIQRMIHTTTCFDEIINNIYFSSASIENIKEFLKNGASIITDTNMIKTGLSSSYTGKYNSNVICYVAHDDIRTIAEEEGITRATASVRKALKELKNKPVILACGNAPTFLYAAIEALIQDEWDLSNVILLAMPVGFINVLESKEYALEFMNKTGIEGIVLKGRYGGSPLVVSALHAIYKLISDTGKKNSMGSEVVEGYACKPKVLDISKPIMYSASQIFICQGCRCNEVQKEDITQKVRGIIKDLGYGSGKDRIKVTRTGCNGACRYKIFAYAYRNAEAKNFNKENCFSAWKQVDQWAEKEWAELIAYLAEGRESVLLKDYKVEDKIYEDND